MEAAEVAEPTGELKNVEEYSRFSEFDIYLFKSGKHYKLYEKLGSHVTEYKGVIGTYFAVWAPNARYVSVIGNFNGWNRGSHSLNARWDGSGIWEGFIPNIGRGEVYKYFIHSNNHGQDLEKADPFALWCEIAPKTASVVWDTWYEWQDDVWMRDRRKTMHSMPLCRSMKCIWARGCATPLTRSVSSITARLPMQWCLM